MSEKVEKMDDMPRLSNSLYKKFGYAVCFGCRTIYEDDVPFVGVSIRCPKEACGGLAVMRTTTLEEAEEAVSAYNQAGGGDGR